MALRSSVRVPSPAPPFGVAGGFLPDGGNSRVDFAPTDFATQIEMHGQRLAWSRALRCPCQPVSDQTEQPDPECSLCGGTAWTYFGPPTAQPLPEEGFTDIQRLAASRYGAFVIRGLLSGFGRSDQQWQELGSWRSGMASLTVRQENRLGFMDRIVHLDAEVVFSEIVRGPSRPAQSLKTRYLCSSNVQMVRSPTQVYRLQRDYVVRAGRIFFQADRAPSPETRLAVHYTTFPTFLVQDIPSANRVNNVLYGGPPIPSFGGPPVQLPLRATLRLEFLPEPQSGRGAQDG